MINTFNMDLLHYAAAEQKMFTELEMNEYNYKTISTFWSDFSIAEVYGPNAIRDTFKRAQEWLCDYKMYTELILVLNHKCWEHYQRKQMDESKVYHDLYYQAVDIYLEHFAEDEEAIEYYYNIAD